MGSNDFQTIIDLINNRFSALETRLDTRLDKLFEQTRFFNSDKCVEHDNSIRELETCMKEHLAEKKTHNNILNVKTDTLKLTWQIIGVIIALLLGLGSLGISIYSAVK